MVHSGDRPRRSPRTGARAMETGASAGYRALDGWVSAASAVGAYHMRGAGCTWNDSADGDFDAAVARARSRAFPSGAETVKQALFWMVAQALTAALILFSYHPLAIALGIGSLALVAIYPFAKRFTWWPQAFLGLAFNWGALLLWAAHTGNLSAAPLFLYAAGFVWTLFYDTIYAHQDKEDDALIGVRSTARLFGENTNRWLAIFMIATVLLMSAASIAALLPLENPLPLLAALAGAWAMGWHMLWQMRRLNIDDPANCLKLFRSNRDTGLLAALFLAAAAPL